MALPVCSTRSSASRRSPACSTRFPRRGEQLRIGGPCPARPTRRSSPRSRAACRRASSSSSPTACRRPSAGSPTSHTLLDETPVALYPPREGFGEVEPHAEVAGERVETLERLSRGEVRVLLTTPRALLERTRLPARARSDCASSCGRATCAARASSRRTSSASASSACRWWRTSRSSRVRGGIFDIYCFGMADPVRLEFWGDEIVDLRHFELCVAALHARGRSRARAAGGRPASRDDATTVERLSDLGALAARHAPRLSRRARTSSRSCSARGTRRSTTSTSRAAAARTPTRARSCSSRPRRRGAALAAFGTLRLVDPHGGAMPTSSSRSARRRPIDRDIKRLRRIVRDGMPTIILCDNEGQAERLDELLNEDAREPSPAALVDRRARRRLRPAAGGRPRARASASSPTTRSSAASAASAARAGTPAAPRSTRSPRSSPATTSCTSSTASASIAASRRSSSAQSTIEVAVDRVRGRRPAQRAALPHRPDRALSRGRRRRRRRAAAAAAQARRQALGAAARPTRAAIQEMTVELLDLYARRKVASRPPHVPDTRVAAAARVAASSSRTRPTSARRPTT